MKYRHSFHAGNFADVHKHVTLLALIAALAKKDKGLLYLETHAGRGAYDISTPTADAAAGIGRFARCAPEAPELRAYTQQLALVRTWLKHPHLYPGSPLLALSALRRQDRAVLIELQGSEVNALGETVNTLAQAHPGMPGTWKLEREDGYARLRAWLPPPERRGLTFIDPPYEETQGDFTAVTQALEDGLRRFPTGVMAAWYPIKDERTTHAWHHSCVRALAAPLMASELWLYARDSRVALNGSGLLIVNPPHLLLENMQVWLPQLTQCLATGPAAGSRAWMLAESPR